MCAWIFEMLLLLLLLLHTCSVERYKAAFAALP